MDIGLYVNAQTSRGTDAETIADESMCHDALDVDAMAFG